MDVQEWSPQTLEHLSELLDGLTEELAQHGEQLRALAEVVEDHATELESLHIRDEAHPVTQSSPAAAGVVLPWSRNPKRTPEDWDALVGWVDMMSSAHAVVVIPRCWLAHEGLVLELEAMRCAWVAAMSEHETKATQELASWYTYLWYPFLGRMAGFDQCRVGHQPDPLPSCTDQSHRPAFSAASADG